MKNLFRVFVSFLACALLGGCAEELKTMVTFHIGTLANTLPQSVARDLIEMPGSGYRLMCNSSPFMYSGDLERVDIARVDTPDGMKIDGFYFKCSINGSRKLLTATAANLNNYIVMQINGKPMGLRRIDTLISDGMLFLIADVPPKVELQKVADEINESISVTERIKKDL